MVIRGAPAIGVASAMGIALGMRRSRATGTARFAAEFHKTCELMAATRPTAVNLFWAIERMKRRFERVALAGASVDEIKDGLDAEARAIHDEDVASCRAIGRHGATLISDGARVLTHCNAGALATAGYGTALGVVRAVAERGAKISVFADETRPFLQGARLTAWELVRDGIPTTVITDSMAGALMRAGEIDVAIVGADRIAANGDVANKSARTVAVLANAHKLPFYRQLRGPPWTWRQRTDRSLRSKNGRRGGHVGPTRVTPEGQVAIRRSTAPHELVTAIVTDRGIFRAPYIETLRAGV
jgi:methylthioribose-1-phosphate isomerase